MSKLDKKVEMGGQPIKRALASRLELLYGMRCEKGRFLPDGALELMAEVTAATNREIAALLDRRGFVVYVSVGDDSTVGLADKDKRRGESRTSGIRCVHTHPNGDPCLSEIDMASLTRLRFDAMAAVAVSPDGMVRGAQAAIKPVGGEARCFGPYWVDGNVNGVEGLHGALDKLLPQIIEQERDAKTLAVDVAGEAAERAVLVCQGAVAAQPASERRDAGTDTGAGAGTDIGTDTGAGTDADAAGIAMDSDAAALAELRALAKTAGAQVVASLSYRARSRDPAHCIGRGKVEELSLLCQQTSANIVIFDTELSGAQARNIEDAIGARVVDRATLILDIFAKRARSREGKLQVELAQLNYRLPRLTGQGEAMSRLGGGIGTRGPGERKLDVDRRHIRRRIRHIEQSLSDIHERRGKLRAASAVSEAVSVALVGYTNAGKSTLFNALCGADALAEDKLFATLDPTSRRLDLPSGGFAIAVDTVGFISKLPHDLVEAFKATLEETAGADIILHVADASSPELLAQVETVRGILASVASNAAKRSHGPSRERKTIVALNKTDKLGPDAERVAFLPEHGEAAVEISALLGDGLPRLLQMIEDAATSGAKRLELLIPYSDGAAHAYVREHGRIESSAFEEGGVRLRAALSPERAAKVRSYVVAG